MKRLVAILFLAVVLLQSTSKLWILTSFYLNRDVISKTTCINRFDLIPVCKGQCVLNQELSAAEQDEQNLPTIIQNDFTVFYTEIVDFTFHTPKPATALNQGEYSEPNYRSDYISTLFHPPQLA